MKTHAAACCTDVSQPNYIYTWLYPGVLVKWTMLVLLFAEPELQENNKRRFGSGRGVFPDLPVFCALN
jgi:hypothetical protein